MKLRPEAMRSVCVVGVGGQRSCFTSGKAYSYLDKRRCGQLSTRFQMVFIFTLVNMSITHTVHWYTTVYLSIGSGCKLMSIHLSLVSGQ